MRGWPDGMSEVASNEEVNPNGRRRCGPCNMYSHLSLFARSRSSGNSRLSIK